MGESERLGQLLLAAPAGVGRVFPLFSKELAEKRGGERRAKRTMFDQRTGLIVSPARGKRKVRILPQLRLSALRQHPLRLRPQTEADPAMMKRGSLTIQ